VLQLLPAAEAVDLDLGVCGVPLEDAHLTITTLREEGAYSDQRHPDSVNFVQDPARDARRRDFTVNAIYMDPWSGEVLDPCRGVPDLEARLLRTVGEPAVRLREDPLRILRAVRFAASADLQIQEQTASALAACAAELRALSPERVFAELTRAWTGRGRGRALQLLVDLGLADVVLPELVALAGVPQPPRFHPEGNVLVHTCMVLDAVPAGDPVQAWTAVLHDVGKPLTLERAADRIRFWGHDLVSARIADGILRRLRAPGELREAVVEVSRDHIRFASLPQMGRSKRERWLRSRRFRAHLDFHRADCLGSHGSLEIHAKAQKLLEELPPEAPPPICTGKDVVARGVPEGPLVGELLRVLHDDLDRLGVVDRDTALGLLDDLVRRRFKPPSSGRR
jgi:tRNA nucleotidyltransferase/poly(A) polymerase